MIAALGLLLFAIPARAASDFPAPQRSTAPISIVRPFPNAVIPPTTGEWVEGSVSVNTVNTPRVEVFYWVTITFSQTLGTALGDWAADAGLGYGGGALLFGAGERMGDVEGEAVQLHQKLLDTNSSKVPSNPSPGPT